MNSVSPIQFHRFEIGKETLLVSLMNSIGDYESLKKKLEKEHHKLVEGEIQELVANLLVTLDLNGLTILEQAVQHEDRKMIEMLLLLNVDINTISPKKKTCGCYAKSKEFLVWLFQKGLLLEPKGEDRLLAAQARSYFVQFLIHHFPNEEDFNYFLLHAEDGRALLDSEIYFYLRHHRLISLLLHQEMNLDRMLSKKFFHDCFDSRILSYIFPITALTGCKTVVHELSTLLEGLKYHGIKGLEEIIIYVLMIPWHSYKYEGDLFLKDLTDFFLKHRDILDSDPDLDVIENTFPPTLELMWIWLIFKSKTQSQLLQAIDHLYSFKTKDLTLEQNQLVADFINQFLIKQDHFWKDLHKRFSPNRFDKLLLFLLKMGVNPFIKDPGTKKNLLHQLLKILTSYHKETYLYLIQTYPELLLTTDGKDQKIVDRFFKFFVEEELVKNLSLVQETLKILKAKEKSSKEEVDDLIQVNVDLSLEKLEKWISITFSLIKQPSTNRKLESDQQPSSAKTEAEFLREIHHFSEKDTLHFFHELFKSKQAFSNFIRQFQIKHLNLVEGGSIRHNFAKITSILLDKLSITHLKKKSFLNKISKESVKPPKIIHQLEVTGKIVKVFGSQTLIIKEEENSEICEVFKFRKTDSYPSFTREKTLLLHLLKKVKKLKSQLPQPLNVYFIKSISGVDPKEFSTIQGSNYVYHFRASPQYFNLAHDPIVGEQAYFNARLNFLHDATWLLKKNRIKIGMGSLGNYNPVPDLFKIKESTGASALKGGFSNVEQTVMRESGLADFIDGLLLLTPDEIQTSLRNSLNQEKLEKYELFLALASICFLDCKILTLRYLKLDKINWEHYAYNEALAKDLVAGFTAIFSNYTEIPIFQVHEILVESLPWVQMAKENSFWVQKNPKGYLKYFEIGKLPNDLYPEGVPIRFKKQNPPQEPCIGIPNGPLALVTTEKIIYIICLFCLGIAEYKKVISKKL